MVKTSVRHGRKGSRPRQPDLRRARIRVEQLEERSLLSYGFQPLAYLGDPVAGAGFRLNDFEVGALNNRGDVLYGNDLGTANDPNTTFGEGVFLRSHGQETLLARSNASAPGGGTFDGGFLGTSTLNNQGDAGFVFLLQPFTLPYGVNAGAYRYSHTSRTVTPVVLPGVTPAPGGGKFAGTSWSPILDSRGDLFFVGIVPTDKGIHIPGEDYIGLGMGVFEADLAGHITSIVRPGDPAPGGGTFDAAGLSYSAGTWVNGRGDITFDAHVAGEEASVPGGVPGFPPQQSVFIAALGSVYVKDGATGQITSIAHAGDPAPGGGVFRQALFPEINARGDVLFTGDLTPAPNANQVLGVFLDSEGTIIPIARPGDPMPGGGHLVTASVKTGNTHLNNQGDVVFTALLDTDVNHHGTLDTGLYQWSDGELSLIARTGTVLPGVGTVRNLNFFGTSVQPLSVIPNSGAVNNNRGQVLFGATLEDGRGVLLLATPTGEDDAGDRTGGSAGQSDSLAVQPGSAVGQPPAPAGGHYGGLLSLPSSGLTALAGTLPDQAVDALFADMGSKPFDDPFPGRPFLQFAAAHRHRHPGFS